MGEAIDEHFRSSVAAWTPGSQPSGSRVEANQLVAMFRAQLLSRHIDFASRWLQSQGEGFYTIGSAGHESNAAVALALRPSDPALLHYRSCAFYLARAAQAGAVDPVGDVLNGVAAATADQISGGRHKVVGSKALSIIPQTSTIGSHMPRALGLAFALGRDASRSEWPADAVVVASIGDASVNHSTTLGALNAAGYLTHQRVDLPLLVVCEDNGLGISARSPRGWTERVLSSIPSIEYASVDGTQPDDVLTVADGLVEHVRTRRRPAVLHLRTVRFMGHAGSDAEIAYRTAREIAADLELDPLLASARLLMGLGELQPQEILDQYDTAGADVMAAAKRVIGSPRLASAADVTLPITQSRTSALPAADASTDERLRVFDGRLPELGGPLTLAQTINAALKDALAARPEAVVFGQDVARKGGVYGLTRGLRKAFGAVRVFDTLLDEQTVLGTALGMSLAGNLPIPEIQYLAYVHNAEDQLRGEAATLSFFSDGQYGNGMVVRIAGLAYQKGFGGHFHNDNSLAVLRDIPGLVVAVPSHPSHAAELLRTCLALASHGRVCVVVEPIALYHQRDLYEAGDAGWLAPYAPPSESGVDRRLGEIRIHGDGDDCLLVTFGNGVPMCLRASRRLEASEIRTTIVDLQWLSPLPEPALTEVASAFDRVLVVDETRASGGVSESVITALVMGGYRGDIARVTSADSFIPLGPAADAVLLSEDDVVRACQSLL